MTPRGSTAPRALTTFKFGILVDFGFLYHIVLEFLESEVIYFRYDLREVPRLPGHLETLNSRHRQIQACSIHQSWNLQNRRPPASVMTSERFLDSQDNKKAPRALTNLNFGNQVDISLLYSSDLEFSKSEVICLRYDLREVLGLSGQ
eukprot:TRINITY_DN5827_c0_g1_i9.p1 TRINITY_DN5827_c0_g1~~TRINITY_DN5827_c0_g1_i9.p1  ORF type:complete len:147 (+),score=0.03 TRINITY_DN5827_c0_g1_i9:123-563(+)